MSLPKIKIIEDALCKAIGCERREIRKLRDGFVFFVMDDDLTRRNIARIDTLGPGERVIYVTGDMLVLDDIDKLHAWAHDMLDEQPEVT